MIKDTQKLRDVSIAKILGVPEHGRRISLSCPFHQDNTPSFSLYPDNSYYCFSCQKSGRGAIDFVVDLGGTFNEAIIELEKYI